MRGPGLRLAQDISEGVARYVTHRQLGRIDVLSACLALAPVHLQVSRPTRLDTLCQYPFSRSRLLSLGTFLGRLRRRTLSGSHPGEPNPAVSAMTPSLPG